MQTTNILEAWWPDICVLKERVRLLHPKSETVALYGSSSIRLWESMHLDLFPLTPVNLGFGGSTYRDCLYFFPNVFHGFKPSALVLYGGDNDLANGRQLNDIVADFKALVNLATTVMPDSQIAAISIKPSPARNQQLHEMMEINSFICAYIESAGGTYIDVFTPMLNELNQPEESLFSEDRLHLNASGYAVWASIIRSRLLEMKAASFPASGCTKPRTR